jgi:hypothetical protein
MNIIAYLNKYKTEVVVHKESYDTLDTCAFGASMISMLFMLFCIVYGFIPGLSIIALPATFFILKFKKKKMYNFQLEQFLNQATTEEKKTYYHLRLIWALECFDSYEKDEFKEIIKLLNKNPEKCHPKEWRLDLMLEYFSKKKLEKYSNMSIEEVKNKLISKVNKKMLKHIEKIENDYQTLSQFIAKDTHQIRDENEQKVFNLKKSISSAI